MAKFGFRSVFSKLFTSVMFTLVIFAMSMMALTHLVHDNSANTRWQILAKQIIHQIDPFLKVLNGEISANNRFQARFTLAIIKKSFDIFDESLHAKLGLYDANGRLLVQTNNSDLPKTLPEEPSWLTRMLPFFSNGRINNSVQAVSQNGFTLVYESRNIPKRSELAAAFNLLTGTILLLIIMTIMLWWIARSMTWRINQMSQQMVHLGEGDFSVRVPDQGIDEIATLAHGFNNAAQKIEQLLNANHLLLAHASHELRTPITRIRLQIEMMDMLTTSLPADMKQKFDKRAQAINKDLNGLNDLVESILLVSRLDAGHAAQQNEHFDIYDLVNQECQHYKDVVLLGEHIVIQGQPKLLIHLIRNLLNNALIHGKPPIIVQLYGIMSIDEADNVPKHLTNYLHVNARSKQQDKEFIYKNNQDIKQPLLAINRHKTDKERASSANVASSNKTDAATQVSKKGGYKNSGEDDKDKTNSTLVTGKRFTKRILNKPKINNNQPKYIVMAVIDQGTGIPLDKRQDIFSPFVRLQQQKKGSGLGLSLVAQIVAAHHGHITTDTYNGHTRFMVVLPTKITKRLKGETDTA